MTTTRRTARNRSLDPTDEDALIESGELLTKHRSHEGRCVAPVQAPQGSGRRAGPARRSSSSASYIGPWIYPLDPFEINPAERQPGARRGATPPAPINRRPRRHGPGPHRRSHLAVGGFRGHAGRPVPRHRGRCPGRLLQAGLDGPLMRLTDLFLSLPLLPLLLVVIMLFREPLKDSVRAQPRHLHPGGRHHRPATSWMQTARVVRGDVLGHQGGGVRAGRPERSAPASVGSCPATSCPTC